MNRNRREEGSADFSSYSETVGTVGAVGRIGIDFGKIARGTGEGSEASDKTLEIVGQFFMKEDQWRPIEIMFGPTDHGHKVEIISAP
jgi:hypothetical protein